MSIGHKKKNNNDDDDDACSLFFPSASYYDEAAFRPFFEWICASKPITTIIDTYINYARKSRHDPIYAYTQCNNTNNNNNITSITPLFLAFTVVGFSFGTLAEGMTMIIQDETPKETPLLMDHDDDEKEDAAAKPKAADAAMGKPRRGNGRKRPIPPDGPSSGPDDEAWMRLLEDIATKRALQRQHLALAKLHVRRSANLLRQVETRARLLEPLEEELRHLRERLREDAARAPDLARLKKLTRQADTPARLAADLRLERMVAMYDSDGDVREAASLGKKQDEA